LHGSSTSPDIYTGRREAGTVTESGFDTLLRSSVGRKEVHVIGNARSASLVIREARDEDLGAIVALLADDELGRSRELVGPVVQEAYVRAFAEMQSGTTNRQLICEDQHGVVACLQLTFIRGLSRCGALRAQLEGVRVARRARGQGVGSRLVIDAIERARAAGCVLVQLTSDGSREDAHRFYARLGFVASHVGMKLDLRDAS
jgi:GNAT superfamily N-acetyltransferase